MKEPEIKENIERCLYHFGAFLNLVELFRFYVRTEQPEKVKQVQPLIVAMSDIDEEENGSFDAFFTENFETLRENPNLREDVERFAEVKKRMAEIIELFNEGAVISSSTLAD